MWIHSVFHAFMLQCCNQIISLQITETSVELNEEYEVENILKRMISEKVHYLIKWKDYDISENIWELKKNLKNCVRTLQCFEKTRIEFQKNEHWVNKLLYIKKIVFILYLIIIVTQLSCDTTSFKNEQQSIMFNLTKQLSQLCIKSHNSD
jgi:hypothetical protein